LSEPHIRILLVHLELILGSKEWWDLISEYTCVCSAYLWSRSIDVIVIACIL
jgi:hypothetical protein